MKTVVGKMGYRMNAAAELFSDLGIRMRAAGKKKDVHNIKEKLSNLKNRNKTRKRPFKLFKKKGDAGKYNVREESN